MERVRAVGLLPAAAERRELPAESDEKHRLAVWMAAYRQAIVATEPGLFNLHMYTGTPTVSGDHYHLEFPMSALELSYDHGFHTAYWFFEMEARDRMPNSKNKYLAYVR